MPLKSTFSDLVTLVNDNRSYKNLRAACAQAQGQPVLPYVGVLLFDLTRAEETAKPGLPDNFVNFSKYRATAPVSLINYINVTSNKSLDYQRNHFHASHNSSHGCLEDLRAVLGRC